MLPFVLKYSHPAIVDRLAQLAVAARVGSANEADDVLAQKFLDAVDQLNHDLGIPTSLAALKESDIPALAKAACWEAHTGYPVPRYMSQEVCETIIRKALPKNDAPVPAAVKRKKKAAKVDA
jgi:alcohol dehydrogenase class IV